MNYNVDQQKEIAQYAVEHDNNYKATGEKYGISYQQVAAWVRKYKKSQTKSEEKTAPTSKPQQSSQPNMLDVLSRKDPVLEAQLREVKKRLGLL
ncbi:helix-turn-helix domain-containing protein [Companilactobacillus sp. HBUAS56275]|uniref:Helix-turn-helix domain-containing protein n=1 Tax=Candidatus Companilactobacillus pullicola TaxID=2838523 RepID=A0A9D2CP50_9LACO|nr:helix-turn-helix domain-containing protein [Candidatus Companilactobacillus pullicola]